MLAARIAAIRNLQVSEARAALADAVQREASLRDRLGEAERALAGERAAWLGHLAAARPAPAILQAFRGALVNLEAGREAASVLLEEAAAERDRREAGLLQAILREAQAERFARKRAAISLRRSEEVRLQAMEDRVSFAWSQQ
jgi:hypothetical protein